MPDVDLAEPGTAAAEVEPAQRRAPSIATITGAAFALWGALIGIQALHDNSFLTHLATGRLILRTGGIPRTDPYSFTAHGEPWVVQSWLASVAYAVAEKADGLGGIRLLNAALAMAIAALVWHLTRASRSLIARVVIAGVVALAGTGIWVGRPLLIGLVCFGLVLALVADGCERDLRWLVPIMWVWVNCHGSFPLGIGYLVLLVIGTRLDGRRPGRELHALGWAVAGTLVGAVNPLGPRLLVFPLTLLQRSQSFAVIEEWKPPRFDNPWQIVFALQLVLAVALLVRVRSWRVALPLLVFAGLALTSARNIVPASLVLVPGMAICAAGLGSIVGDERPRSGRAALGALVVVGLILSVAAMHQPDATLTPYPERAVTWLDAHDLLHSRVVAPDYVGNYLEARYHGTVPVFIDDRVDMYPEAVVQQAVSLLHVRSDWPQVLADTRAGVVLWPREKPLTPLLEASPEWRVAWSDATWVVFVPSGS